MGRVYCQVVMPMKTCQVRMKRAMDIVVAALGLVIFSPVLLAVTLAIWATMGRPVLFRQIRPGLRGRPFVLFKLRTMRTPKEGERSLDTDALRLTRLGRLLRTTSLDELPELWNVLRGDMSLVGPRPLLMEYLARYTPDQARRHELKPGMTGWAQINGRNAISWEEKFQLDLWYVEHQSFRLDLKIILLTVWLVFRRCDIQSPDHATMPEFRGTISKDRNAA
jgi:sugar transferase EpsL